MSIAARDDNSETRTSLRDRRRAGLIDEIHQFTLKRYKEVGYDGFNVNDICDGVGISARTLFRHFKGKDDILARTLRVRVQILTQTLKRMPDSDTVATAYRKSMREMLTNTLVDPAEVKLMQTLIRDIPSVSAQYTIHLGEHKADAMDSEFARRLKMPLSDPHIKLLRSFIVTAAVNAMTTWAQDRPSSDLRILMDEFLAMVEPVEQIIRTQKRDQKIRRTDQTR